MDNYSLALVDLHRSALHWLVVNIPSASLVSINDRLNAVEVYKYLPPSALLEPNTCATLYFLLFRQSRSLSGDDWMSLDSCPGHSQLIRFV